MTAVIGFVNLILMGKGIKIGRTQKGNTTLILILLVFILIGVAAYFYIQSTGKQKVSSEPVQPQTEETVESEGKPLPEKDAVGTQDLEIIDRYPGSVRTMYENPSGVEYESVTYVTKDPTEEVKEYYFEILENEGWDLVSSSETDLRFEKNSSEFGVHFYYDQFDKILKYTLDYTP